MKTVIGLVISLAVGFGLSIEPTPAEKTSACELQRDPAAYQHKVVEVDGIVSHGFEDFTLSDPQCARGLGIWLEYGGKVNSKTIYCCGTTSGAERGGTLVVEGIAVPLIDNKVFRRFDARISSPDDVRFRARIKGRFFAGDTQPTPSGRSWPGYGHLGCCTLLVIQQVVELDGR